MPAQIEKHGPFEVVLRVEVPAERVARRMDREYAQLARRTHVRGFRPGKAPRHVLRRLYGKELERRVGVALALEAIAEAVEEHQLQPVTEPEFEPPVPLAGAPLQVEARFQVQPELRDISFEGLAVERPDATVSEEDVEARLQALREANATIQEPEPMRPAREGDLLRVDAEVFVEGEKREELTMREARIDLGNEALLPELKEALLGASPGEEREATVRFADDHGREELRGKEAVFRMKVVELRERVLPDLDDEFAKDVSDHETLEALREELRRELQERARARADDELLERLLDKLVEINEVPVPPAMVQREEQRLLQSMLQIAAMAGIPDLPSPEELHEEVHARAERRAKATVLLSSLAKQEHIEVTDEDLRAEAERMAEKTGQNPTKVLATLKSNENLRQNATSRIVERKLRELLVSRATLLEPGQAAAERGSGQDVTEAEQPASRRQARDAQQKTKEAEAAGEQQAAEADGEVPAAGTAAEAPSAD